VRVVQVCVDKIASKASKSLNKLQTLERDASSEFTEPYKSNKRNAQLMNVPESQAACVEAFKTETNWIKKNGFYFLFSNFLLPSSTPYLAFAQ